MQKQQALHFMQNHQALQYNAEAAGATL
jgi:hypothetical protein